MKTMTIKTKFLKSLETHEIIQTSLSCGHRHLVVKHQWTSLWIKTTYCTN